MCVCVHVCAYVILRTMCQVKEQLQQKNEMLQIETIQTPIIKAMIITFIFQTAC